MPVHKLSIYHKSSYGNRHFWQLLICRQAWCAGTARTHTKNRYWQAFPLFVQKIDFSLNHFYTFFGFFDVLLIFAMAKIGNYANNVKRKAVHRTVVYE